MKTFAVILLALVVISSSLIYSMTRHDDEEKVIGMNVVERTGVACSSDVDCKTPGRWLIRSDCPYESRCIDNRCVVICPSR